MSRGGWPRSSATRWCFPSCRTRRRRRVGTGRGRRAADPFEIVTPRRCTRRISRMCSSSPTRAPGRRQALEQLVSAARRGLKPKGVHGPPRHGARDAARTGRTDVQRRLPPEVGRSDDASRSPQAGRGCRRAAVSSIPDHKWLKPDVDCRGGSRRCDAGARPILLEQRVSSILNADPQRCRRAT